MALIFFASVAGLVAAIVQVFVFDLSISMAVATYLAFAFASTLIFGFRHLGLARRSHKNGGDEILEAENRDTAADRLVRSGQTT